MKINCGDIYIHPCFDRTPVEPPLNDFERLAALILRTGDGQAPGEDIGSLALAESTEITEAAS